MKLQGLDPTTHKPLIQPKNQDVLINSEESMHHDQNLGFQENMFIPTLKDYDEMQQQKTDGSIVCVPNQEKLDDSCIKNLDMASSVVFQNRESLGNITMDSYQNLMDNLYFWDCFTSLGDSFP